MIFELLILDFLIDFFQNLEAYFLSLIVIFAIMTHFPKDNWSPEIQEDRWFTNLTQIIREKENQVELLETVT